MCVTPKLSNFNTYLFNTKKVYILHIQHIYVVDLTLRTQQRLVPYTH